MPKFRIAFLTDQWFFGCFEDREHAFRAADAYPFDCRHAAVRRMQIFEGEKLLADRKFIPLLDEVT